MVEVLISCMHQVDYSIIEKSNLKEECALVINQCNTETDEITRITNNHRMVNTNTKGLSVSRNMAIKYAKGDICVISDDDEVFVDSLSSVIETAYKENPNADVIIFNLGNRHQKLGVKKKWLKKYELLRVASWQITFRRSSVLDKIWFDEKLGAGTGNGGGEENKFLFDCKREGLKILYVPVIIAQGIEDAPSTWFFGYDDEYFLKLGCVLRYLLGSVVGFLYCIYTIFTKRNLYKKDISAFSALKNILRGFFDERLEKTDVK